MLEKAGQEGRINFVGNVEARDAVEGAVDVIVTDGYSGNILLKTMEGTALYVVGEMKKMFKSSLKTKLAALLMKDQLMQFKKKLSSDEIGGTAMLGISKPPILPLRVSLRILRPTWIRCAWTKRNCEESLSRKKRKKPIDSAEEYAYSIDVMCWGTQGQRSR